MAVDTSATHQGRCKLIAFWLLLLSSIALLAALILLNRFAPRGMRLLWDNQKRERSLSFLDKFPINQGAIVFLGDTHVADFRWEEYFPSQEVRNLGIQDETAAELRQRLSKVTDGKPRQIILHTGGSDIRFGFRNSRTAGDIKAILNAIRARTPETQVVVCGILPQRPQQAKRIRRLNSELAEQASQFNMVFVDLFDQFSDETGGLSRQVSGDQYHLCGSGYATWLPRISGQIHGVAETETM